MTAAVSSPALHTDADAIAADLARDNAMAADLACYNAMLRELAGMGMDLARALHRQATGPDVHAADGAAEQGASPPASRLDAAGRAFDRAARGVRRTILLVRTINEPLAVKTPNGRSRASARRHIARILEDEIRRDVADAAQQERLTAELHERLDGPDVADDLDDRPASDIIGEIRRDLGLDTIPGADVIVRRTPADIAVLCARAAGPGPTRPGAAPGQSRPDGSQEAGSAERFFRLMRRP